MCYSGRYGEFIFALCFFKNDEATYITRHFDFITPNGDAHLKNFSLIDRNEEYRLSPAYNLKNISLHLVEPRIFALDKDSFRKGMKLLDKYQVSRTDFEEFGCRIGLPERVVKRELDAFAKENQMIKVLIEHSFLSDILKHQYCLSMDYRRKMLVW
ncbi:HipA domain-containing protein [Bacteroides stercorirosoris]|uniref:HipA domain-containing protein n=1 Tax=Bacteroides stercorirosoris TaxID=871324 RepID=UPI00286EC853|nr:HipA domain-containing protein [Bacteroides stercorirosoris]